jgi:putative DNA primase/helicase
MVLEFIASGVFEVPSFIIQRFLLLQGKGSNGKSVLIKLIEDIVGRDACSFIVPGSETSTHDMNTIVFKKFNLIEEGDMSKKLLSSIKSLVSGGAFNSSEKFKSPITIQCNTKFVVAINNEVPEYGMDNSHARRMLQVKMTNTFDRNHPDFDPHLQEKLRGELSGIFNLILGSYINLKNRGFKIIEAQQSIEEKNDIMAISDDVYGFSLDCLEIQPNHKFRAKLLWECYRTWCADQGIKYAKTNTLFAKIFKNHPDIKSLFNFTKGEDKHGVFYLGIGLKPKQDDYDI